MRPRAKVLVIDDEDVICRSCLRVLAPDGYEVRMAFTGREALREVENDRFDLALLDLKIPGSGGLGLLRAIRKVSPETEVIVITGYPSVENAKESIRLGAFDYLTKPFVPETLRTVVSQVLACRPWKILERC